MTDHRDINCEYCRCVINTDEAHKIKNDENDFCFICESCYMSCIE